MAQRYNDQNQMNPLQINERGWWALLIRVQAMAFPFVIAFFVWQVRMINQHEIELQKLAQWKSGFINYPNDANDMLVRIQAKTDIQFSTLTASIGSLRDSLTRMDAEQKIQDQLRQGKLQP